MSRKCKVCDPAGPCREARHHLYVVHDRESGLTKIGLTMHVTRRLAEYRKQIAGVSLHGSWVAGCEYVALSKEEKALNRLAKIAERDHGDWFKCEPEVAAQIAGRACG